MAGCYEAGPDLDKDGVQRKAKDGTGLSKWYTDPQHWGLRVSKEVSDVCMGQGRTNRWDPTKMRPVMLTEKFVQPAGKELQVGTYIMATRNMKLRIVPSPEMRRKYGTAADAARAAAAKGLLEMPQASDQEMIENIRGYRPDYRVQVIATGGADRLLLLLAESRWMSDDEKKVVKDRILKVEEEKGGVSRPEASYDPQVLEEVKLQEPVLPPGIELGEAGAGADDEVPLTAATAEG